MEKKRSITKIIVAVVCVVVAIFIILFSKSIFKGYNTLSKSEIESITISSIVLSEEDQSEFLGLYNSTPKTKLDKNAGEHGSQASINIKCLNGDRVSISITECCNFEMRIHQKGEQDFKRYSISDETFKNYLRELAKKYDITI